jgi:glycosyltransferase involved in cell wall biosynthesis
MVGRESEPVRRRARGALTDAAGRALRRRVVETGMRIVGLSDPADPSCRAILVGRVPEAPMNVSGHARRLVAPVGRPVRRATVSLRTRNWPPHSRLFVEQEAAEWVLAYEARQLARTATALGVRLGPPGFARGVANQSIFHLSQFALLLQSFERRGNHLGLSYFHGRPGTPGMPEFDACFETLRKRHEEIDRIQVTNRQMEALVLSTGIAAEKVHRIPIGIDVDVFRPRDETTRLAARTRLGLPDAAFVVGSFQKDGVGWGDGLEPKLIKGPDVLLAVAERLVEEVPELHFLLTGPARGYVRAGLERLGIPYRHLLLPDVDAVAAMYPAIDVCLVASRDEGGPRAVLESMATRVPLVTSRVGQAADLVRGGVNGWMVEPEDVDGLLDAIVGIAGATDAELDPILDAGRRVAEENDYVALRPRWRSLLEGFVSLPGS